MPKSVTELLCTHIGFRAMLTNEQLERIKQNAKVNPCIGIDEFGREFIDKRLATLEDGEIVVELGTWMGGLVQHFATRYPNLIFHTVDICNPHVWNAYATSASSRLYKFLQECDLVGIDPEDIIHVQQAHLSGIENIVQHVGSSLDLDIDNISMLIVDSLHTEEHVTNELNHFYPKMKKERFIIGDDYFMPPVRAAFTKFSTQHNLKIKPYGDRVLIST
jgi:hypothetical protein